MAIVGDNFNGTMVGTVGDTQQFNGQTNASVVAMDGHSPTTVASITPHGFLRLLAEGQCRVNLEHTFVSQWTLTVNPLPPPAPVIPSTGSNELFVYSLFKNILSSSMVIEGRFFVIKTLGNEVNSDNFGEVLKDALTGLTSTKKYPCVLMQAPKETQRVDDKGWSTLECSLFFLTPYKRTGDGDIKTPDLQTNTSNHTLQMDWKDMRECAGDFRKVLRTLLKKPDIKILREYPSQPDIYTRMTFRGNDNVCGCHVTFWLQLWDGLNCNSLADYTVESIAAIVIPPVNPHPLHKQ